MNDGPTILRILLKALGIDEIDEVIEVFYPKDGSKSTAKPIKTYVAPVTPGQEKSGETLTPAQQAAQKNEPTKAPKQSGPPQAPAPAKESEVMT